MPRSCRHLCRLLPLLVAFAVQYGCAVNPVSGQSDFVLMSEEQEVALGRKEHPNILKQYQKYSHAELQAYIEQVGQPLAASSHRPGLVYRFTLLDSPEVNAFALPGGYVYITRGLLAYLNSEAELAAVLGHEIGHVTARHGVRQYSAAMATSLGVGLGSIFVPELRSQGAQDLMNVLGSALLRGYGRDHELEADRLGAEYLARTGYDPQAMIQVIKVLKHQELFEQQLAKEENREPRVYHGVFSSHPDNDQRLHEVVGAANAFKGAAITRSNGREQFVRRMEGVVFGPSAREGVLRGQAFFHGELNIGVRFPDLWRVDNLPDRLQASAPQQAAILQLSLEELGKQQTPETFLKQKFKTDTLSGGEVLKIDGIQGYTGVTSLNTSLGKRDARVAAVFHNKQVYLFVGVSKEAEALKRFESEMLATIRSFHILQEAERKLAEPLHIHVITAKAGATFRELATQAKLQHHAEEQLRLLNDRYPKGEPHTGELIKIIQ